MNTLDFGKTIEELLRRPLFSYHINQLMLLKDKEQHGELSEVDKIYISDTWDRFRSLPPARQNKPPENGAAENGADALVLVQAQLRQAHDTIEKLREAAKRLGDERDRWQKRAEQLASETAAAPNRQDAANHHKFEQAKRMFAKLYHPNALAGRSQLDIMVRGEIFKEFWAELERIEAGG